MAKAKSYTFPNSTITTQDPVTAQVLLMARDTKRFGPLVSMLVEAQLHTAQGRGLAATVLRIRLEDMEAAVSAVAVRPARQETHNQELSAAPAEESQEDAKMSSKLDFAKLIKVR